MTGLRGALIPPERNEAWLLAARALQALPDEVVDALGRDVVAELVEALTTEGPTVVATTGLQPSEPASADVAAAGGITEITDREAAEMLHMTTHSVRGALSPGGARAAARLVDAGRRYRSDRQLASEVGNRGCSVGSSEPRSFHDPINAETAASILGVTDRRVRQLTDDLGARKVGNEWLFERSVVVARSQRPGRAVDRGDHNRDGEAAH